MKPQRVFIVDDDRDFAQGLGMLLQVEGYDVSFAYSGEEALEIFKQQDFDLTFMDVKLPGMNGVESFIEIRKIKPDAKVMMMTAFSVEQLLQQAVDGGVMGVLSKPLDIDKVLHTLETASSAGIILVADDDPDFARSLEIYLTETNYKVLICGDGKQAVDRVLENGIDILILDLRLPILSGLEVYLELKRLHRTLPTLIVTGYAVEETEAIEQLKQYSSSDYLVKPFAPEVLLSAIQRLMQNGSKKNNE